VYSLLYLFSIISLIISIPFPPSLGTALIMRFLFVLLCATLIICWLSASFLILCDDCVPEISPSLESCHVVVCEELGALLAVWAEGFYVFE
jgi:hypothetical protein